MYSRVVLTVVAVLLIINLVMQFSHTTFAAPAHELIMLKGDAAADYVTQRLGARQVVGFSCTAEETGRCFVLVR